METLWRGLWPRAVCIGAIYYSIAVKPGCRQREDSGMAVTLWGMRYPLQLKIPKNVSQILQ